MEIQAHADYPQKICADGLQTQYRVLTEHIVLVKDRYGHLGSKAY